MQQTSNETVGVTELENLVFPSDDDSIKCIGYQCTKDAEWAVICPACGHYQYLCNEHREVWEPWYLILCLGCSEIRSRRLYIDRPI